MQVVQSVIYKATNRVTGKSYIGYDSAWPKRQQQHTQASFNKNHQTYHSAFHRAIRKYGANTFVWQVLFSSNNATHTLTNMEPHFIREHNTHYLTGHGYNMTYGGEGHNGPRTEKANRNNSLARMGKILTPEHRKNISLGCRKFGNRIAKEWILTSPEGIETRIKNLTRYCLDHHIPPSNMFNVVRGIMPDYQGWKVRRA